MTLSFAQRCAEKLVDWLKPHVERVEIAGSVRRCRPDINDIDLVVVPKMETEKDLFGAAGVTRNLTWKEIDRRCEAEEWTVLRAGPDIVSFVAKAVQVDVFWAEPAKWGTTLLCRTGSKEHNIWLCNYAATLGAKWFPGIGLYRDTRCVAISEEAIYDALGIAFIPPVRREASLLPFAGLIRRP